MKMKYFQLLLLMISTCQALPIAFTDITIDGKKHPFVIVEVLGEDVKYTVGGVTLTKKFEELPQEIQSLVIKPTPQSPKPQPTSVQKENETTLNHEQRAYIGQRKQLQEIKDNLSKPESYSQISSKFYPNEDSTIITHKFRAVGPNGKKRTYEVSAKIDKLGDIISIDWKNQSL